MKMEKEKMNKTGFDCDKYYKMQSEKIRERIRFFGGKLYLEFGGKLFDDYHAARVLPGFEPDTKVRLLTELKDQAEIVIVINAGDIEKNKVRGDLGITYDQEVLRLIDAFSAIGLYVSSVVIAQYNGQSTACAFRKRLDLLGVRSFLHYPIENYPANVRVIVSEEGLGRNEYIETSRPLVVVTAPGPGSGKMATCLSQLYHENKRGVKAGYAKFETFPVWNLPLAHPVNLAYEAATADLDDVNMIDPYHLEVYGTAAVNYNRDVEVFPLLNAIFRSILGASPYKSPTDMGVNMAGFCVSDDGAVCAAAKQEIIRRYYSALCDKRQGKCDDEPVYKIELLMDKAGVHIDDRRVTVAAKEKAKLTGLPAAAVELPDGRVVTGKTSSLFGASSSVLLNAIKVLAGVDDGIDLIARSVIEPVQVLKTEFLGNHNPRLHSDETLVALSVSAATNPTAKRAMEMLSALRGCQAHSSVILSQVDVQTFRKLGLQLTCEPQYQTRKLYHK